MIASDDDIVEFVSTHPGTTFSDILSGVDS